MLHELPYCKQYMEGCVETSDERPEPIITNCSIMIHYYCYDHRLDAPPYTPSSTHNTKALHPRAIIYPHGQTIHSRNLRQARLRPHPLWAGECWVLQQGWPHARHTGCHVGASPHRSTLASPMSNHSPVVGITHWEPTRKHSSPWSTQAERRSVPSGDPDDTPSAHEVYRRD